MDQKTGGRYGTHLSGPAVPLGGGCVEADPRIGLQRTKPWVVREKGPVSSVRQGRGWTQLAQSFPWRWRKAAGGP